MADRIERPIASDLSFEVAQRLRGESQQARPVMDQRNCLSVAERHIPVTLLARLLGQEELDGSKGRHA